MPHGRALNFVAPRAGARIETSHGSELVTNREASPPARGRGLKQVTDVGELPTVSGPGRPPRGGAD